METPPDNVVALNYSSPHHEQRRSAVLLWLIAVLSLFVALIAGDSVLDEFRHRERTQAYIQYTVSQGWRMQNDPSYVPPPFTQRKFVYASPLELKAFYVCVLFGAIGGFAIRAALRRQRLPNNHALQRADRGEQSSWFQCGPVPGRPLNADPLSSGGDSPV